MMHCLCHWKYNILKVTTTTLIIIQINNLILNRF